MKTTAAVAFEKEQPLVMTELDLDEPRPGAQRQPHRQAPPLDGDDALRRCGPGLDNVARNTHVAGPAAGGITPRASSWSRTIRLGTLP